MRNFTSYDVVTDCDDEEELRMVLKYGKIIETSGYQFARVAYGSKTAVVDVKNEEVISFFDRDLINEYEYRGGLRCMKNGHMIEYHGNHQEEVPKKGISIGNTMYELLDYFDVTENEVQSMERYPSEGWHHYTVYHGPNRSLLVSGVAIGFIDDNISMTVEECGFTAHAKERLVERGILLDEIDHVLRNGKYVIDGENKWVVVGFVDDDKIKVVLDGTSVVTVYTDREARNVPKYSTQKYLLGRKS